MIFKELIQKNTWEDVKEALIKNFFEHSSATAIIDCAYKNGKKITTQKQMEKYTKDNLVGYQYVFETLKRKRAVKSKDKKTWTLFVAYFDKDLETNKEIESYYDVTAQNGDLHSTDEHYKTWIEEKIKDKTITEEDLKHFNSPINYAIEFTPWSQWLSMIVDNDSLVKCGETNFIAQCLYEMTFFGFIEQKVKNKSNSLKKQIKALEDDTLKTTPLNIDEFMENMNKWEDEAKKGKKQ